MPDDPADQPDANPSDASAETAGRDALDGSSAAAADDALSDAVGDLDASDAPATTPRKPTAVLCPYCGHTQRARDKSNKCDVCGGLFEPLSRKATQIAMGPWFLRDQRNPFRPGCSFDVIKRLLEQGKIGPTTVLRGPTTRQFWSIARNVPGLAHHLGFCHACRGHIEVGLTQCPLCDAEFKEPKQRNELGLTYPNRRAAETAQRALDRQLALLDGRDMVGIDEAGEPIDHHPDPPPEVKKTPPPAVEEDDDEPGDLLDDALGIETAPAARPQDVSPLDFTPDDATQPVQSAGGSSLYASPVSPPAPPSGTTLPPPPDDPYATGPSTDPLPYAPAGETRPGKPWVVILLISLNVLVALGILAYFVMRGSSGP